MSNRQKKIEIGPEFTAGDQHTMFSLNGALHENQNHFYCQAGFHIQGIFSGVFGADLNIEKAHLQ